MAKPLNRFDVQVVYPDGCVHGIMNRKDVTLTLKQVIEKLREFADDVESNLENKGMHG